MVESRWFRRAGPGVAAIGAVALVASTTLGAPPAEWRPPTCAGPARTGSAPSGAWYRLDTRIVDGVNAGQRLSVGLASTSGVRSLDLDPESFASGPIAGAVLAGSDDGAATRLSLIDVGAGCAWSLGRSTDVVRRATLSPDGSAIIEFRVDRRSRADLGVWRRSLDGRGAAERILPPIPPDARFGPTWLTELSWSDDRTLLAVQSCGEVACRVRWLDLTTRASGLVADPGLGDMIGMTRDRLVARAACRGLPCPIKTRAFGGRTTTLVAAAGQAIVAHDARGAIRVVYEADADGRALRSIGIDGTGDQAIAADLRGRRLVAGPSWAMGSAELPLGWIAFGPNGRLPIDGPVGATLRRISDGRTVPFDEVPR